MTDILYLSIVSEIKKDILTGKYSPGEKIESETELMEKFSTTKITIRKSLALLCNEGFIYSIPSKGYFVQTPNVDNYTLVFNKFDKLNTQIDEVKLLSVKVFNDKPGIYIKLQLDETNSIVEVKRLLLSNGKPIAYECVYMKHVPQNPVVESIINFANYAEKIDEMHSFNMKKQLKINAILPTDELRQLLQLNDDSILYEIEEKVQNTFNNTVISLSIYYTNTKYLNLTALQSFESN